MIQCTYLLYSSHFVCTYLCTYVGYSILNNFHTNVGLCSCIHRLTILWKVQKLRQKGLGAGDIMHYWVKLPPVIWHSLWQVHVPTVPLLIQLFANGPSVDQYPAEGHGSCLLPGPVLTIWEVNPWMEDLSVFLSSPSVIFTFK